MPDLFFRSLADQTRQQNVAIAALVTSGRDQASVTGFTSKEVLLNLGQPWANQYVNSRPLNAYLDYYYSGQDIIVQLSGIDANSPMSNLPIMSLAFSVSQEKRPIYGMWDYTLSAVMRGTRIVSGTFVIATTYPNYIEDLISASATANIEQAKKDSHVDTNSNLTETDQALVQQYWRQNLDPALILEQRNLFSAHPPFDIVITYGVQEMSVGTYTANPAQQFLPNTNNNPAFADVNERLISADPARKDNQIILQGVEILSVQQTFEPGGTVCSEVYNFFAKEMVKPSN